jgi:hypothetical protein
MISDWTADDPPVPEAVLQAAVKRIGLQVPSALLKLYRKCDGGEGSLPFQPWRFLLWRIEQVAALREDDYYKKHYAQFVFFGSNGAGEYFGIDIDQRVFFMDAVAGEHSIVVVAQSFDEFAAQLGQKSPNENAAL